MILLEIKFYLFKTITLTQRDLYVGGVLGAVYWWMVKLGFGVAALLSGTILSIVGFDPDNATESAVSGMRMFYTFLPIAGVIGALLIMKNYDITEEKAAQIKEALVKKRAELANPA